MNILQSIVVCWIQGKVDIKTAFIGGVLAPAPIGLMLQSAWFMKFVNICRKLTFRYPLQWLAM